MGGVGRKPWPILYSISLFSTNPGSPITYLYVWSRDSLRAKLVFPIINEDKNLLGKCSMSLELQLDSGYSWIRIIHSHEDNQISLLHPVSIFAQSPSGAEPLTVEIQISFHVESTEFSPTSIDKLEFCST